MKFAIASHVFLLLFLPLVLAIYYGLCKRPRQKVVFLLLASYGFYALADLKFLPLLFLLSVSTFWLARRNWSRTGVAINLATLILFKYWNFGVDAFIAQTEQWGVGYLANLFQLGLPLGISFYVFKHIGYLSDVYQKKYPASDDLWGFLTFSSYFPQLSAGPISSFQDTASQFEGLPASIKNEQAYTGLVYLSMGLAKKVLIADSLGAFLATPVNSIDGFSGLIPAWYLVIAYAIQLYFDFSGYTDMVLGISMFFGIMLPPNFNNPYLSNTPREFWARWHMSLSNWFRYYLFSPLSRFLLKKWGTERGTQAQYTANIITMSLVGLWHGSSWSFILWGLYHGVLLNIDVWWRRQNKVLPTWAGRFLFLLSLMLGWALFMSPDVEYLKHLFLQLFGFSGLGGKSVLLGLLKQNATSSLIAGALLAISGSSEAANVTNAAQSHRFWQAILWGILAAFCLLQLSGQIQFLYIQF